MDGHIVRQSSSYRQGLVLGLTMAEIMLLLVFCLLIAMAAFLRIEQGKTREAERQLGEEKAENYANRGLVAWIRQHPALSELLKGPAGDKDAVAVSRYWRELVDSRAIVEDAKGAGYTTSQLREGLALAGTLKARGIEPAKAVRDAEIINVLTPKLPELRDPAVPPLKIVDLVQRGTPIQGPAIGPGGHKWPPIINLSQARGYRFESGSAELSQEFRDSLQQSIPGYIQGQMKAYDVDVIEVVGHTDEQPVGLRQSNLDHALLPVLKGTAVISSIVPADNAGLGLARAVSVASVLRQAPQLTAYKILPLSGAQLINNDETLATSGLPANVQERRRIEIRLRKSTPYDASMTTALAGGSNSGPQTTPRPRQRPAPPPPTVAPPATLPVPFRLPGSPIY